MTEQDLTALLEANLTPDALNVITPEIRGAMTKGLQVAGDLAPAYALIDKIGSGGTPDPQMTVAALAGAATAINPVAGAAIMAAGELAIGVGAGLEALFKGLGLISDAPKAVPFTGLIQKGAPVPSGGPGSLHPDPIWQTWDQFARWWWPQGGATDYGWYPTAGRTDIAPIQSQAAMVAENTIHQMWAGSPTYRATPGNSRNKGLVVQPTAKNAFESFLLPIMKKNLENWANANPYVDPRGLTLAAIQAWNDKHQPSSGDITYTPNELFDGNWVGFLLGSKGDSTGNGQRMGSQVVHMGTLMQSPAAGASVLHVPATNAAPAQTLHVSAFTGLSAAQLKGIGAGLGTKVTVAKPVTKWHITSTLLAIGAVLGLGAFFMGKK
jgi:hypothetical protein